MLSGDKFVGLIFVDTALKQAQIAFPEDFSVTDLISSASVTVNPDTTLAELQVMFKDNSANTIAVLDAERLIGLVQRNAVC